MCRVRRFGVALLVALLLVGATTATPAGATEQQPPAPGVTQLGDAGIEPDGVLLRADLRADGDARWTVEYRVRLNDENTTAAFESLRDDIESNETAYTTTFAERMRATAQAAENATGREMGVQNVSVRATRQQLPQEYGVVTYQFEWTGFAIAGEDSLEAGDALAGLFLDRQTTFVVAWPDAYATTDVQPAPDERRDDAVAWVGPTDFAEGEPVVSLSTTATDTSSSGGGDGPGSDDGNESAGNGVSMLVVAGGALLVVAGAVAVVVWRRSREPDGSSAVATSGRANEGDSDDDADVPSSAGATTADDTAPDSDTSDDEGAEGDTTAAGTSTDETADSDETTETADSDETAETTETADAGDEDDGEGAPWDDELLSNEERVLVLLEHNDGRMKQQAVASELDWSDAKTSQVIGKLRDAEEIETFRLGRENVVSLPGSGLS